MGSFIFHPFITAPLLLLALAFIPAKSKFNTGFNILIVGLYIFVLAQVVQWPDYGSYYLRYFFIFIFLLACIRPVKRFQQLPIFIKKRAWLWLPKGLFMAFLIFLFSEIISTNDTKNEQAIELNFPLKNGSFYISQGGSSSITNYHNSSHFDRYAYDIEKLNQYGKTWNNAVFPTKELHKYNVFNDTVYSPCNGKIIEAIEHYPDHNTGTLDDFKEQANQVIIKQENYHISLLHLSYNSVMVNQGDSITAGQPLALVGNTGRSQKPHLHIHAYNWVRKKNAPILFNGKILVRNDVIEK